MLVCFVFSFSACGGGNARSGPTAIGPADQSQSDTTAPSPDVKPASEAGTGGGTGGSPPPGGLGGGGGLYAVTKGDMFFGIMPELGPVVATFTIEVEGEVGSIITYTIHELGDLDPFTHVYQVVEDGRIIATNLDLNEVGIDPPEDDPPTETWIDPETGEEYTVVSGEVLASFVETATENDISEFLSENSFTVIFSWFESKEDPAEGNEIAWFNLGFEGDLADALAILEASPIVEYASPSFADLIEAQYGPPNDPNYYPESRFLNVIRVVPSVEVPLPPPYSDQVVAVLDSGVLYSHPDMLGQTTQTYVLAWTDGYWVINHHVGANTANPFSDHGTQVAGMISAATNNEEYMASCAPSVKVLPVYIQAPPPPDQRDFYTAACGMAVRALREVFPHGSSGPPEMWNQWVRVVNMSWGNAEQPDSMEWHVGRQIHYDLLHAGNDRLYVGAAGNNMTETLCYPAAFYGVLGVTGPVPTSDEYEWYMGTPEGQYSNYIDDGYQTYPISGIFGFWQLPRQYPPLWWQESLGYETWPPGGGNPPNIHPFYGTSAATAQVSALGALLYTRRPWADWESVSARMIDRHKVYDYSQHYPIAPIIDFHRALTDW